MIETRKALEKKLNFLDLEMSLITTSPQIKKSTISKTPMPDRNEKIQTSLTKIQKEWHLLQSRREERMNNMVEKIRKEEENLKNEENNEKEVLRQNKISRLAKKIEEINNRMKERETKIPKDKENLKLLLNQTPQAIKTIQESKEKYEKEKQQNYEEKLRILKERCKPLSKEELEEHAKRYEELIQQRKEKGLKENRSLSPFKPSYRSPLYEIIETQDQEKIKEREEEKRKKQEYLQKIKEFQEKIKKDYFPQIDPQKKQNMEQKIFKLKHPAFKFFIPKDAKNQLLSEESLENYNAGEKNPKDIGKSYLAFAKSHKKFPSNSRSLEKIETTDEKNSLKSSKYENYLKKIKVNTSKKDELDPLLKDNSISAHDKKEKIFAKADKWEHEAERKELLNKIKGKFDDNEEVDELRVKAIKAKLALIQNNSQVLEKNENKNDYETLDIE